MFASRVQAAAASEKVPLQLVSNPAQLPARLAADCRLVLVDLTHESVDLPTLVAAVRAASPAARIIAYGPHVDHAALASAADAGCDEVLSRGQFDRSLRDLVRSAAN